jgi:hypothetical protein
VKSIKSLCRVKMAMKTYHISYEGILRWGTAEKKSVEGECFGAVEI